MKIYGQCYLLMYRKEIFHMKYGIVSYEKKYLSLLEPDTQNMGDWFQTIAMENLYDEWGIHDYLYVSRNNAKYYNGEKVVLCFNCFNTLINSLNYKTETFPLSKQIIPVFFGLHLHNRSIPNELKEQFLHFGPIGCRDEETLNYMLQANIPAYLSGCVTALFPRRNENSPLYEKIYFVDTPKELDHYVPEHILKKAEYKTNSFPIQRLTGSHYMTEEESKISYQTAKKQLELLRDTATLVVTSRLHIASPCIAMGIPVILASYDFNGRFSWIDKYIPFYAKHDWQNINWNPQPVNYEPQKNMIKNLLRNQLLFTYKHYLNIENLTQHYMNRKRFDYNCLIKSALHKIIMNVHKNTKYAICGVISASLTLYNTIMKIAPHWELVHVYDNYVKGYFEHLEIENSKQISPDEEIIYFIVKYKDYDRAKVFFHKINKKFVLVDFHKDTWETNI